LNIIFLLLVSFCLQIDCAPTAIRLDQQYDQFKGDIRLNGILRNERWPNATVYYMIGYDMPTDQYVMLIKAIEEIEQNTPIQFVELTDKTQPNYVKIINGTGCNSNVGMQKGEQILSLQGGDVPNCWLHEIIVHELLHAVGLNHEHDRYDRDKYVTIYLENVNTTIDPDAKQNFDLVSDKVSSVYGQPYDYQSIMHYAKDSFAKTGTITMMPIDRKYEDVIGHALHGTKYDWEKVWRIYTEPCDIQFSPGHPGFICCTPPKPKFYCDPTRCQNSVPPGTVVYLSMPDPYHPVGKCSMCNSNGKWISSACPFGK